MHCIRCAVWRGTKRSCVLLFLVRFPSVLLTQEFSVSRLLSECNPVIPCKHLLIVRMLAVVCMSWRLTVHLLAYRTQQLPTIYFTVWPVMVFREGWMTFVNTVSLSGVASKQVFAVSKPLFPLWFVCLCVSLTTTKEDVDKLSWLR